MNENKILLLVENKENTFESPKDDLLYCFSKSNTCAKELDKKDVNHAKSIHHTYLHVSDYIVPAPVFIADTANSSLDIAHHLIQENIFPPFASVLCRNQKTGRGQLRRHWSSPEGNIYAALCLPHIPPFSTEAAAPALGGLITHALNNMGYDVALKWPNDILQKQDNNTWCKVAGILLEERHNTLVAGIGINLNSAPNKNELRKDSFIEAGILQPRLDTNAHNNTINTNNFSHKDTCKSKCIAKNLKYINIDIPPKNRRNTNNFNSLNTNYIKTWDVWLTLVEQIFLWYKKQDTKKYNTPWQSITQQYLAFMDETVIIYNPIIKDNSYQRNMATDHIKGRVSGINSSGELLLQTATGLVTILGGTFSQEDNE